MATDSRGALPMIVGGTGLGLLSCYGLFLALTWTPPPTRPLPPRGAPNVVEGRVVEGPPHVGPFGLRYTCAEIVLTRQVTLKSRKRLGSAMAGDCILAIETDHGIAKVDASNASTWTRAMGPTKNERAEGIAAVSEVPELASATFDEPPTAPLVVDVNPIVPGQSIVVLRNAEGKTDKLWLDGRAELDAHFDAENAESKRVRTYTAFGGLFAGLTLVLLGPRIRAVGWAGARSS